MKKITITNTIGLLNFIQMERVTLKQSIQVVTTFLNANVLFPYQNKDGFVNDLKRQIEKSNVNNNPQVKIFITQDPFKFQLNKSIK